jgi:hypothetical protein
VEPGYFYFLQVFSKSDPDRTGVTPKKILWQKGLLNGDCEVVKKFITCFFEKRLRVCEIRYIFAAAYDEIAKVRWSVRKLFDKIGKSKASKLG